LKQPKPEVSYVQTAMMPLLEGGGTVEHTPFMEGDCVSATPPTRLKM
jgi:hypothetical protein